MKQYFLSFFSFIKSVYSEADGSGSSSRILTTILALVCCGVLCVIVGHLIHITDVAILTAWLTSFPIIVGALALFFMAPYGINKGSGSFTDIANIVRGKKNDQGQ
jgi:hypothetical protein